MIRHLVHLRFRGETSEAVKNGLYERLAALSNHIDGIKDFQVRRNISVEQHLVRGFDDMFWFDFVDEATRDRYLHDEVHMAIGADIVACLEGGPDGVFVCDIDV